MSEKHIFTDWRMLWALQFFVMLIVALCATYLPLLFPAVSVLLRAVFLWILPCTLGPVTACAATRRGLISYAAWILPPLVHSAVPWLCIGFPPSPGSMLLCAFVSLVGAAAGDVLQRRDRA